jgi:hypothetical protein
VFVLSSFVVNTNLVAHRFVAWGYMWLKAPGFAFAAYKRPQGA